MTRAEAARLLREIVMEIRQRHPGLRMETVGELLDVGELRVSLEILCDNLIEEGLSVSEISPDQIAAVASWLGMPGEYWQDLTIS